MTTSVCFPPSGVGADDPLLRAAIWLLLTLKVSERFAVTTLLASPVDLTRLELAGRWLRLAVAALDTLGCGLACDLSRRISWLQEKRL